MPPGTRVHGAGRPRIVLLDGGPGARGEVTPVGEELASRGYAVLEPVVRKASIAGVIEALCVDINGRCGLPVTLVGWSWGAWIACLYAAAHPDCVMRVILVGSGPFRAEDADTIRATRTARLTPQEREEWQSLAYAAGDAAAMDHLMRLFDKMDAYAPINDPHPPASINKAQHHALWAEGKTLRETGRLLEISATLSIPVDAIHGSYDPHPVDGVAIPLSEHLPDFRCHVLDRCGHKPWRETYARDAFFDLLEQLCR